MNYYFIGFIHWVKFYKPSEPNMRRTTAGFIFGQLYILWGLSDEESVQYSEQLADAGSHCRTAAGSTIDASFRASRGRRRAPPLEPGICGESCEAQEYSIVRQKWYESRKRSQKT